MDFWDWIDESEEILSGHPWHRPEHSETNAPPAEPEGEVRKCPKCQSETKPSEAVRGAQICQTCGIYIKDASVTLMEG